MTSAPSTSARMRSTVPGEHGCKIAKSADEACKDADAVVTMLPAGKHVAEVYRNRVFERRAQVRDPDGLLDDRRRHRQGVESEAQRRAYTMVDAPVSGGIAAADARHADLHGRRSATKASRRAKPFLEKMGKAVIHAGGPGAGQAAKICNNMLLGATMAATCEAFVLAQKLGLDPQTFFDISSKAQGQSWSMTSYCPVPGVGPETPADRDYEGGFAAALMLKDLKLAMEAAQAAGAYTPMGGEAEELYQRFVDRGGGTKDFSALIKMIDDSWVAPERTGAKP